MQNLIFIAPLCDFFAFVVKNSYLLDISKKKEVIVKKKTNRTSCRLFLSLAVLVLAAAFTSCKGEVNLLESMAYNGGSVVKFEYDDQNRIAVMHYFNPDGSYFIGRTLTYKEDDLVHFSEGGHSDTPSESYERKGNTIHKTAYGNEFLIIINKDGYIIEDVSTAHEGRYTTSNVYKKGNLTNQTVSVNGEIRNTVEYKYDNKKSPFTCNTPKWFLQSFFHMGLKNNILERTDSLGVYSPRYVYEYNSDGYPATQTMFLNNYTSTIIFSYNTAQAIRTGSNFDMYRGVSSEYYYDHDGYHSRHQTDIKILAADARELPIGSFYSGNMGLGEELVFRVRTGQAGFLTVEADSNIDTVLTAYDEHLIYKTENDDWDGYNPRIEFIALANAVYYFKLSGFGGNASGSFRVMSSHRPLPAITPLRSASYSGNIESEQEYWFSIVADKTGILRVQTSGETDTLLEGYDKTFTQLVSDDDSGEDFNALINLDVIYGETYYIKLRAFSDSSGLYEISAHVDPYPIPTQLTPGSFHNANIEAGEEHWYSVRTTRSGRLKVETTGNTDTVLRAYADDYTFIIENDDNFDGENVDRNARLEIDVEATTTIFRLRSFGEGPYRIFASME